MPDGAQPIEEHDGGMSSEHPSLSLRVSDVERARAESLLQDAYCEGRLDEVELDQRLGMVMVAQTRRDLNASVSGLPPRVAAARLAVSPKNPQATGLGAAAHLSALFTWIFGPLFFFAVSTPGTPARREAARAFNFQLVAGVLFIVTAIVSGILLPEAVTGLLMALGWVGWLTLTVVGGARALAGQPWQNPVLRVLKLEVLDPRAR